MRILWLQPYFPWPCTTGGKTRQYNLLKSLHARGHKITLLCLCKEMPSDADISVIEGIVDRVICMPRRPIKNWRNFSHLLFSGLPLTTVINGFDSNLCDKMSLLLEEDWDIVQLEHSYFYESFYQANKKPKKNFIITEHNIESRMGKSVLGKLPAIFHPLITIDDKRYQQLERQVFSDASHILAVTEHDKKYFDEHFKCPVTLIDNGVDCSRLAHVEYQKNSHTVCFLGNFDYYPNIDAVQWCIESIMPLVHRDLPDIRFKVFGHNCQAVRDQVADHDWLEWGGFVESLDDVYKQAGVFLTPIRHGGGSKLKVLEAMAAAMPIVGTPQAFSGLAIADLPVAEIHDSDEALADAVVRLLNDMDFSKILSNNAREWVKRHHDWEVVIDKLETCYKEIIDEKSAS